MGQQPNDDRTWITLKGDEAKATGEPVYLETRQMPGWSAALPRYLIWCEDCQTFQITHPHGYRERLQCHRCRRVYQYLKARPSEEGSSVN